MFKHVLHKISAILMAFALLWILAGSLVEFHQRYVFHKQVDLWQAVVTQTGKDFKKTLKLVEKTKTWSLNSDLFPASFGLVKPVELRLFEKSIFSRYLFDLITTEYQFKNILRGPPSA